MKPQERLLLDIMRQADVPGLSITKLEKGRIAWTNALGRRDAGNLTPKAPPVDTQTVFEAASLGKPIVALAALCLVEEGTLKLDDRVDTILPYKELSDPRKAQLTARMLLSHTSGLSFGQPTLDTAPGTRFSYSTEGFRYLQRVIEKIRGESLERWARRTIFTPLSMSRTSFVYSEQFAQNRAKGRNWLMVPQEYITNAAGTGAFDLITTSLDYARLWEGVLAGKLISAKTLALMFTPVKTITGEFYDGAVPKKSRAELASGLGILLQKQNDRWVGFQWGDNGGSTGLLVIDPGAREALIYLSNAEDGLHAAEALVRVGGMRDQGAGWVGYEQYTSKARRAWKRITLACDQSPEEGAAVYRALLTQDRPMALSISRNLGYYNRFKGRLIESEPFFRNAALVEKTDTSLLEDWAEALVLVGKVEEAARVQEQAILIEPTLAKKLTLPAWVKAARTELATPASMSQEALKELMGQYGDYVLEAAENGAVTLAIRKDRRKLVPVRLGEFISADMVYRVRLEPGKLFLTLAGKPEQEILRSKPSG